MTLDKHKWRRLIRLFIVQYSLMIVGQNLIRINYSDIIATYSLSERVRNKLGLKQFRKVPSGNAVQTSVSTNCSVCHTCGFSQCPPITTGKRPRIANTRTISGKARMCSGSCLWLYGQLSAIEWFWTLTQAVQTVATETLRPCFVRSRCWNCVMTIPTRVGPNRRK